VDEPDWMRAGREGHSAAGGDAARRSETQGPTLLFIPTRHANTWCEYILVPGSLLCLLLARFGSSPLPATALHCTALHCTARCLPLGRPLSGMNDAAVAVSPDSRPATTSASSV
jgi:hypothetical protein